MKACWYVLEALREHGGLMPILQSISQPRPLCAFQELVEYYQNHSLKESFKQLDTTLKYPYKSRERSTSRTFTRSPGRTHLSLSAAFPMGNLTRSVGCGLGLSGDLQPPSSSLLPSPSRCPIVLSRDLLKCGEMRGSFGWVHSGCPAHVSLCVWGSGCSVSGGV